MHEGVLLVCTIVIMFYVVIEPHFQLNNIMLIYIEILSTTIERMEQTIVAAKFNAYFIYIHTHNSQK